VIAPEVILAIATAASGAAAIQVIRSLAETVRRRLAKDKKNAEKRMEIIQLAGDTDDADAAIAAIAATLQDVGEAVIVLRNQVVIKDSAAGESRVVVRNISPDQRTMIDRDQAPLDNAALFHAWLDDTRQPEASN
jgi:hypothetical protein